MSNSNNIILIGLMGAGKTTVGKMLARHLGMRFIDSDHEIERRTGVKIPVIFELEGEEGFRARETAVLSQLCQMDRCCARHRRRRGVARSKTASS